MYEFILTIVIGFVLIGLGIGHTKGHISSLHSYHRKRVTEEDRIPFGRLVGRGTIIIGCSIIVFGVLSLIGYYLHNELYSWIGTGVAVAGVIVGSVISFYAMKKYNKGIF